MPLDYPKLASHLAVDFTGFLIMAWIIKRARRAPDVSRDGRRLLRMHRGFEIIGWAGGSFFLLGLTVSQQESNPTIRNVYSALFGGFFAINVLMVWMAHRSTITYSDSEVRYVPLFGRPFYFSWDSVVAVTFSIVEQGWVFRLADGRKVRVSPIMKGHLDFISTARRHISIPIPDALPSSPI